LLQIVFHSISSIYLRSTLGLVYSFSVTVKECLSEYVLIFSQEKFAVGVVGVVAVVAFVNI